MSKFEVRAYEPRDLDAYLELHAGSFVGGSPLAWWNWRFVDLPRTKSEIWGAFDPDGRCVAMYAGVYQQLWLQGETHTVLNHSDIAVHPDLRDGLAGSSVLLRATKRIFKEQIGGSLKLVYGFPQPALLRFLVRKAAVEVLTDVTFLVKELAEPIPTPSNLELRRVAGFGPETDELWTRCRAEFGAAIVRDSTYLNWRFQSHPKVDYELLECRDVKTGQLRGLAVLRTGGWDPSITSLCEWLVPLEDREAELCLLSGAEESARQRGTNYLVTWFPTSSLLFTRFQAEHRFFAKATPYQELFLSYDPQLRRQWFYDNWYQTMGDIDFF